MAGRIGLVAIATLLGIHVAVSALAQEEHRPSLSQRLQRFRNELLGDKGQRTEPRRGQPSPAANATRKISGRPKISPPAPEVPEAPTDLPEGVEMMTPGEVRRPMPVAAPGNMHLQSARRAQGTGGSPAPLMVSPQMSSGQVHRPVEEARRRSMQPELPSADDFADESVSTESVVEPLEDATGEVVESTEAAPLEDVDDNQPVEEAYEPLSEQESTQSEPVYTAPPVRNSLRPKTAVQSIESETPAEPADRFVDEAPAEPVSEPVPQEPAPEETGPNVLFTAQSPVISLAATGPRTVMIGKEAEFVVTIRNQGAAANQVVVKINVPNDVDVISSRATLGDAQATSGGQIHEALEWSIDRLEANSEETLNLKLVPRKSSPLDLAMSYTFTPETSQTMVEVQEPKLAMSLSGPTEVLFGQTKVYKLTISNPGNGDTHNVSVGLLPIGASGEAQGTHKLGTLKAGESKSIDIELTARQAGALTIKAQSFADGGLRAEAAEQVLVRRAALQVTVEAPRVKYAGTPATYHVTIENTGDAPAENVSLSAMLPPESKFLAASGGRLDQQQARVNWAVGSLAAGGQRVYELNCALNTPGDNRLQFAANGDGELSAAATSNTRVEAIADLKLEVRDPQGPVAVGDDAVYEVRIRNRGTKAAQGVDLAVFFSEGLEPASADGGPHDLGPGQVVFKPLASIAAGEAATFYVRARAASAGNHVFRAEVTCETLDTKLAAEEATHFYGDQRTAAKPKGEPTPAKPRGGEPEAVEYDDPPPLSPSEY